MRMIAEEMRNDTKPLRLSYYGQCYRYEEFKKGRYREFFQYGVELIGAMGPLAEAEVIALAISMLDACGLKVGRFALVMLEFSKGALSGLGLSLDTPDGGGEPPVASAMRFLDKGDDAGLANLLESNGIAAANAAPLRALADLEGGSETLKPAGKYLDPSMEYHSARLMNYKLPLTQLQHLLLHLFSS